MARNRRGHTCDLTYKSQKSGTRAFEVTTLWRYIISLLLLLLLLICFNINHQRIACDCI